MSELVNVHEAKTHLSRLLERVRRGEEVVIGKGGRPVARLVPVEPPRRPRVPGSARGQFRRARNFDTLGAEVTVDDAYSRVFETAAKRALKAGSLIVAAPGVNVYSSFPMPERNARLSDTSMATPHVAGITALFAEANPKATAAELWTLLTQHARRLSPLSTDVGAGLVMAP